MVGVDFGAADSKTRLGLDKDIQNTGLLATVVYR